MFSFSVSAYTFFWFLFAVVFPFLDPIKIYYRSLVPCLANRVVIDFCPKRFYSFRLARMHTNTFRTFNKSSNIVERNTSYFISFRDKFSLHVHCVQIYLKWNQLSFVCVLCCFSNFSLFYRTSHTVRAITKRQQTEKIICIRNSQKA